MTYLIDASIFIFRAWFSIPDSMTDANDNPVNAVYGYARFLSDFIEAVQPAHVAAAFDVSLTTCFRNEVYPDYKANREPAPPELKRQFEQCREVTRALGVRDCADTSFEADDLIGTLATGMREAGHCVTIVSRDKDLVQILQSGDVLWDYAGGKKIAHDQVIDVFGVRADQFVDYLALAGDSVDNIPGAPGVGPKTASALLAHFDSVDEIYANLDSVENVDVRGAKKLGARLAEHRDKVAISKQLAQICCEAPVAADEVSLSRCVPDLDALDALYDSVGFGRGLRLQARRISDSF
ncbi:MAG: 5'-3' exonuclease H3TH domain-containing protein [Gammaproteobacteria bacterium]